MTSQGKSSIHEISKCTCSKKVEHKFEHAEPKKEKCDHPEHKNVTHHEKPVVAPVMKSTTHTPQHHISTNSTNATSEAEHCNETEHSDLQHSDLQQHVQEPETGLSVSSILDSKMDSLVKLNISNNTDFNNTTISGLPNSNSSSVKAPRILKNEKISIRDDNYRLDSTLVIG
jgi:cation transport ATPase